MHDIPSLFLLACLWLAYFLSHSWLASLRMKHWVARHQPSLMPWYRLFFNGMALLLLMLPLGLMWHLESAPLWQWQGVAAWISHGLTALAIFGFVWSLNYYDGKEFIGLRQLRNRVHAVEDQEHFHLSPLHRFVRHPWYFLGLVLVWTQAMDPARLVSGLAITAYFIVGSMLEEKKLIVYHGDRYRRYRERVPGLIPIPWRYLSREQARSLSTEAEPRTPLEASGPK